MFLVSFSQIIPLQCTIVVRQLLKLKKKSTQNNIVTSDLLFQRIHSYRSRSFSDNFFLMSYDNFFYRWNFFFCDLTFFTVDFSKKIVFRNYFKKVGFLTFCGKTIIFLKSCGKTCSNFFLTIIIFFLTILIFFLTISFFFYSFKFFVAKK